jgi:hypothetical protein
MFAVSVGNYEVLCQADGLPNLLPEYRSHATLAEHFDLPDSSEGSSCFCAVGRSGDWPFLVVVQQYAPASGGFHPGLLLVPETERLFVGAGRRLLGYDLSNRCGYGRTR